MFSQLLSIKDSRVLVVGDIMVDHYISGKVRRISPEAPVPVLTPDAEWTVPGGAANVALNLQKIGSSVGLVCALGQDENSAFVKRTLEQEKVRLSAIPVRSATPRKTRIRTELQHIVRVDHESTKPLDVDSIVLEEIETLLEQQLFNVILLSDYSKGLLSEALIASIIDLATRRGVLVLADPKKSNPLIYKNVSLLKPNLEEARALTGWSEDVKTLDQLEQLAREVSRVSGAKHVVVTGGSLGAVLVDEEKKSEAIATPKNFDIVDVSGAGDTFISYLAAGLSSGLSLSETCRLATFAATISCTKVGTYATEPQDLIAHQIKDPNSSELKIVSSQDMGFIVHLLPRPIVFTNGCFDVLHPGHISSLEFAKQHGETLIVGINSDSSVKKLKGEGRPLQSIDTRLRVLAALAVTTLVCEFDNETPLELIKAIKPDFLAKGNDYVNQEVVGGDFVQTYGGKILFSPLKSGFSTTQFVNSITNKG